MSSAYFTEHTQRRLSGWPLSEVVSSVAATPARLPRFRLPNLSPSRTLQLREGLCADELSVAHYGNVQSMFANERLNGVIVSTPTEHHCQPTLAALEAGCHVLVEKPIMATVEEAQQVIKKVTEGDRHVLVGHHRRYYSLVHEAREIVRSGKLGRLVAVTGQWNTRKHDDYYSPEWRKKRESGPVLTNLIHEIDTLRYICGEVASISAEVSHDVMGFEKEDAATMVLKFRNGALATFLMSDRTPSPWIWEFATGETTAYPRSGQNVVRFMGTTGALEFPNLVLWHHGDKTPDWNHAIKQDEVPHKLGSAFISQIAHFCAVISGHEDPVITARDATESLKVTLAVFEAARTGNRILL